MNIGVDCISIDPSYKGGISTYTFGLLTGFASELDKDTKLVIFCTSDNKFLFEKYLKAGHIEAIAIDNYRTLTRKLYMSIPFLIGSTTLWRIFNNLYVSFFKIKDVIESNCDLLYTPTTTLKFYNLKIPTVLSMHDIQQCHYPDFFSKQELRMRKLTFENSAKYTTYFQASSHFIKNDLQQHFSCIGPDQIEVIPEGVNAKEYSNCVEESVLKRYNLPDRFLFFPAQLWKHKNHITVLRALKKIETEYGFTVPLVMVGARYSSSDELLRFVEENNMHYVSYLEKVDFPDLVCLYKQATFLITAVLYESSSLPVLEAAASGTPIIASDTEPNIETSDILEINLFRSTDVEHCAHIIGKCWGMDDNELTHQINKNTNSIHLFSWEGVAHKYLNLFKKINASQ